MKTEAEIRERLKLDLHSAGIDAHQPGSLSGADWNEYRGRVADELIRRGWVLSEPEPGPKVRDIMSGGEFERFLYWDRKWEYVPEPCDHESDQDGVTIGVGSSVTGKVAECKKCGKRVFIEKKPEPEPIERVPLGHLDAYGTWGSKLNELIDAVNAMRSGK